MDYYSILGLSRGASDDEIKKAYRSMAMKHHPDRGGDETKFKEISQAYEILSDPEKKQMVDAGIDPLNSHSGQYHNNPFDFHFNSGNFEDIFSQFGFGFKNQRTARNRNVGVAVELTLEDVLNGKTIDAEIAIPSGEKKIITINIPPGVEHGQQIRYAGMGDRTYAQQPAGDLLVSIIIRPHHTFKRDRDSLYLEKTISVWDAILGTALKISTLDKKEISITIPPGTQPETVFSCRGEGLPTTYGKLRGNLLVRIKVEIPKNLKEEQLSHIRELRD